MAKWDPSAREIYIKYVFECQRKSHNHIRRSSHPHRMLRKLLHCAQAKHKKPLWLSARTSTPDTQTQNLPSRRALPDLDPEAALQAPFFSPGPLHALKLLPSLRPRVFSIHGGGSADPLPEIGELQISSTGVGGGGNGGLFMGGVSAAEVDGGHFMAMKNPRALSMELAQWMEQEHDIWRERRRDRETWVKLPVEEKQSHSKERIDRARKWDGKAVPVAKL